MVAKIFHKMLVFVSKFAKPKAYLNAFALVIRVIAGVQQGNSASV